MESTLNRWINWRLMSQGCMLPVDLEGCSIAAGRVVQETIEDLTPGNYDNNLSGFDKRI